MRLSQYFIPVLKEDPVDAVLASHKFMIRAGMLRQQNAGIYIWLPLGLKVLKKIENIVREEMNNAGAIEILMPCIQPEALWAESGRSESYGEELLRIQDRHESKLLFGPTNEEVVTNLFKSNVKSYKELPKNLYHIQWKFRDEIRPRFGLLRGREFFMKDAYSFDVDRDAAEVTYNKMFEAYIKAFNRMGLKTIPAKADTGPIGGDLSHEFHVISEVGENEVFYESKLEDELVKDELNIGKIRSCYSMSDDMHKEENCSAEILKSLKKHTSIEVGHIFYSGIKYTEAMNTTVLDQNGKQIMPHCGCYGIGISRLVAAIIEASHDDKGIIWPLSVAPFHVSLINIHTQDKECNEVANQLYNKLQEMGIEVLYDDTNDSPGSKFKSHDLIGMPWQIVISSRLVKENVLELKDRKSGEMEKLSREEILKRISNTILRFKSSTRRASAEERNVDSTYLSTASHEAQQRGDKNGEW